MAELGPGSVALHQEVGELAAGLGLDLIVAVEADDGPYCTGALRVGRSSTIVVASPTRHDAACIPSQWMRECDAVLIKGSRSAGMDAVLRFLDCDGADRASERREP